MDGPKGTEKIVVATGTGVFFGTAVGAVESVWAVPKLGAQLPKFTAQAKHIGARALVFGAVAALYTTAEYTAESVSQKTSPVNAAIGGAVAGIVPGIVAKNARVAFASSLVSAAVMTAATYWNEQSESAFDKYAKARAAEQS
ncbi:hypothetical protein Poli38472_011248 [Pythium oligandrum]|uniref:NADH dehydrogenase [ubiquinone] 1 alpha subcomplex subunit 11 n=1 Tax=Pythium oligandrum TaxID=41045 RepID=A0A8K1CSR3_PYTOL|nr:hypothetical protein Poli38472_011248 [Pythium oligandrum]|eukprot:TMW67628.1 hypothetical protein Poli38472_011248 [Pythium oligandrum]